MKSPIIGKQEKQQQPQKDLSVTEVTLMSSSFIGLSSQRLQDDAGSCRNNINYDDDDDDGGKKEYNCTNGAIPEEEAEHRHQQQAPHHLPFYGLFVPGWTPIHAQYCDETQRPFRKNWFSIAITIIWSHLREEWQQLTAAMHQTTPEANLHGESLE